MKFDIRKRKYEGDDPEMAFVFSLLALLFGLAVIVNVVPSVVAFLGRTIGGTVRSRTQQRRELLLNRAAAEEKGQPPKTEIASEKPPSSTSLDEEWEKVDKGAATSAANTDGNGCEIFSGIVGFFHPFCNAGGGGERVLFAAILATQQRYPNALCVVYTGDHEATKDQILTNVRNRFNIHLHPSRINFLYLSTRDFILPSTWPRFTLLGQSLGSLAVAWDAFNLVVPDIFIDTMGYAFTLAACKWLFPDIPTGAYVHYPTISTDMLRSLSSSVNSHEGGIHAGLGTGLRGRAKQAYWELFAKLYSKVGGSVDVVMTNSTWTQRHMSSLWGPSRTANHKPHGISVVYPPCAVSELAEKIPVNSETEAQKRTKDILYIAQFRPEKCHGTIIDAFHNYLETLPASTAASQKPKLILVGSVRDDADEKRVYKLRLQAQSIRDSVQFIVNAKWPQILDLLATCSVGVNGMWNEHFGIGVVEYQAAGLISVVNDSGGPKEDIVVPIDGKPTGELIILSYPLSALIDISAREPPLLGPYLFAPFALMQILSPSAIPSTAAHLYAFSLRPASVAGPTKTIASTLPPYHYSSQRPSHVLTLLNQTLVKIKTALHSTPTNLPPSKQATTPSPPHNSPAPSKPPSPSRNPKP